MSLVVLKNQGYQEYKDSIADGEDLEKSAHVVRKSQTEKPGSKMKVLVVRALILMTLTAILFISAFLLLAYLDSTPDSLAAPYTAQSFQTYEYRAPSHTDYIHSEVVSKNMNTLWKCDDGRFTNQPDSNEQCVFIGEQARGHARSNRFITPGAPSRS